MQRLASMEAAMLRIAFLCFYPAFIEGRHAHDLTRQTAQVRRLQTWQR
ncbi:MAG: hypothetical protein AAF968_14610 [Pseudomonadota bacterium]